MAGSTGRRPQGIGLTGQDWWGAFELSWPRGPYHIVTEPKGRWLQALQAVPRMRVPFLSDSKPAAPWVWEKHEAPGPVSNIYPSVRRVVSAGETVEIYRLGWPAGGIFVPDEAATPAPSYAPIPRAREILLEAQQAGTADTAGLLAFVNRWGILGVGIPAAPEFGADGVEHTGEALRELSSWLATLHALQQGTETTHTWADLIAAFDEHLKSVRFSAGLGRRGLVPRLPVQRLLDALYLELWDVATGGKRLRRCKRCERFFLRSRADRIFCTGRCARLWHVRAWKRRHRRPRTRRR
jgi:uncharacterized protein DUF6076